MSYGPRDALLRAGLELGDAVVGILPRRVAYGLADLLGQAWYRSSADRRRLVRANLTRVNEAIGKPLRGEALREQVRAAFVAHARYYLEVALLPRMARRDAGDLLVWDDRVDILAIAHERGVIGVSAHFGNFEPAAIWMAAHDLRWVTPVEELKPRALYDYLRSRRGVGGLSGELVTASGSARRVLAALRRHEMVAIAADRDVGTANVEVTLFGHLAQIPSGPASLAVLTGSPVIVITLRRTAPGRFAAHLDQVPWTATGDRDADVLALTQRTTDTLARHIAEAPEQWWGAFQPVWADLTPESVGA